MDTSPSRRSIRLLAPAVLACATFAVQMASVGVASAADIISAGPLSKVTTTPDLNCAVNHTGDTDGEFFEDTACATFVTDGTNLYGPATIPAGESATEVAGYVAWTPVSQSPVSGTGAANDPYKIVTVVTGGPFTVTQTDTYVVGRESMRTDVQVKSSSAVNATVYRAGDCFLQDSDEGLGELFANVAPTCRALPTSVQPNRILQWYPLTSGSRYMVEFFDTVWAAVGTMQPLPNIVASGAPSGYDNGAGLSWSQALAAGATATFSHLTIFSPSGELPLVVSKSVTPSTVGPGEPVKYTITVSNTNTGSAALSSIADSALPAGFTYVPGSSSGATTADPAISGATLTWAGPFTVPAASGTTPGSISLTFSATASTTPGTYTNSATAVSSEGETVADAINVAPVVVQASTNPVNPTPVTPAPGSVVTPKFTG